MCYTVKSIDDVRNLVLATRGLSGLADLSGLVSKACRRVHRLIGADLAAIAIYDGKDSLIIGAAEGTSADLVGITLPRGSGLGWRALERSMPATTGNCAADADHLDDLVEAIVSDDIRGLAAVPIEFGGNWLGVMYAGMRSRRVSPRTTLLMSEFGASLAPLIVTAARAERAGRLAVEEERQRIAQQLHDTAGQILFKISMSAQELQQAPAAADPELVCKSAREIEADAAEASGYLREAMHNLMPTAEALPVTIRRDVATFSARTGIATEVVTLGSPARAKPEIETVLLSVVREALHNIEKHARANAVVVSVAYQAQEVVLAVEDDGKGLPADFELNLVPGRRADLGIPGLMQKVDGVAGTLRLGENDDGGTSVRVAVPVAAVRP
jgi:signal transduction histidine kinase